MTGHEHLTHQNPIEAVAKLIAQAELQRMYIEQQDVYPLESQRAARILPAIEESIEEQLAGLTSYEQEAAHRMAELINKLPPTKDEAGADFEQEEPVSSMDPIAMRDDLMKRLREITDGNSQSKE